MKVMLVNPVSSLIANSWAYKKFFTPIAPLGLAYIASLLEKNGFEVLLIDQFASKFSDKELLRMIKKENPGVLGFSALTPVVPDIKRLVSAVRETGLNIKIVLGNIHATCFPEEILKEDMADIVIRGEGEVTMLELCKCLADGKDWGVLAGISFLRGGKLIHNPERLLISDLDSLPLPAWHMLNISNYTEGPMIAVNKALALPILTSRGCLYRCYYCSQDKVYNNVRFRDLNKVVDEMEYFSDVFKVKFFGFCDAYFPFDEASGLEFCDLMIKRGLHKKLKWCTETRVDKVTPRLLKAMKESGVHLIMYGIEVGNQAILNKLNKGTTLEQAREAVRQTNKHGILAQGLFVLGLPGETPATCNDTINFAKELDCDFVKFNIATPYPGSRFFDDFKKTRGTGNHERFVSWIDWSNSPGELVYTPEGMDSDTLRVLQRRGMSGFYMRPKVILRHIAKKTISYKNIFYGGLWLTFLLYSGVLKRFEKFFYCCKKDINKG